MEVGVAVWLRDINGDQAWLPTCILSKENRNGKIVIAVKNENTGEEHSFQLDDENQESDDVKLRNDDNESQVENLINLPYLHEPAILYSLEERYQNSNIYTYTGPILIAMNPFKSVPLYTGQILESYYNLGLLKSQGIESTQPLSPHVYAIADAAYRDMMKIVMHGAGGIPASKAVANQCVLISGESGAGKTESTKIVLKYLTTVGSSSGVVQMEVGSVMDRILQSNPILEAFGNARTLRNDNSSRFGKFIELNFNKRGHLIGGRIRTYLLEKVRLPCQQLGERNFHIFYQMAAGATEEEMITWHMLPLQETWYTSQGEIYALRHVDDKDEFKKMRAALHTLKFAPEHQTSLLRIMAGLLHLGQLQFQADNEGEGSIVVNDADVQRSLDVVADLLGVQREDLASALTSRLITARSETVVKKLSPVQASDARDALAKGIYGRIFDWIVRTINTSIEVDSASIRADIGVLDIFGFECFKSNSFEQLCINYTNETLQQQFNQFVFKMEQKEYELEKIEWSFISFPDNQDCLDLIEHRQKGLLAYLDDECRLPGATDEKLASRLYKSFESNARFSATPAQKRDSMFCIKHYAGVVVYCARTFVEKNKDELPKEAESLMLNSRVSLLGIVFTPVVVATGVTATPAVTGGGKVMSVGSQFKEQLASLMEKIYATAPHYIRCLKPNDDNVPDNFNRRRTTEQLRYGGVLEAVRVARSGFPVRLTHAEFYSRYRPLANPFNVVTSRLPRHLYTRVGEARELCEILLLTLWDESVPALEDDSSRVNAGHLGRNRRVSRIMDVNSWKGKLEIPKESLQLGINKVFLRKTAHDLLEARRSRRLASSARRIQAVFRGFLLRSWFMTTLWAVKLIQRVARGTIARVEANKLRYQRSARLVQTAFRQFNARLKFVNFMGALITLQSFRRGRSGRERVAALKKLVRTVKVQRFTRGLLARKKFNRLRKAVIRLQSRQRRFIAREELKRLKAAAKDLGQLKQSNDALKAEIEFLRARAAEDTKKMIEKAAAAKDAEFNRLSQELVELRENFQKEYKQRLLVETKLASSESLLATVKSKLSDSEERVVSLESLANKLQGELKAARTQTDETQRQLSLAQEAFRQSQAEADDALYRLRDAEDTLQRTFDASTKSRALSLARHTGATSLDLPVVHPTTSPTDMPTASASFGGAQTSADELLVKERKQREILEEEIARLRHISVDLRAQVEGMKRSGSITSTAGPSSIVGGGSVTRRPDLEPRRKSRTSAYMSKSAEEAGVVSTDSIRGASFTSEGSGGETHDMSVARPPLPSTAPRRLSMKPSSTQVQSVAQIAFSNWDEEDDDDASEVSSQIGSLSKSLSINSHISGSTANGSKQVPTQVRRGSSNSDGSTAAHAAAAVIEQKNASALDIFEKNLEIFRNKMKQGVRGYVWDGAKVSRLETTIKLDASGQSMVFEQISRRFTIFSSKTDIHPVRISEVYECIPSAEVTESGVDVNCLMTMVVKPSGSSDSRILALELTSKEERNVLLTGVRSMVSQKSMQVHGAGATSLGPTISTQSHNDTITMANPIASFGGIAGVNPAASRPASALSSIAKPGVGSPRGLGPPAGARAFATRTTANTAAHRRMSVRDVALEEALGAGDNANGKTSGGGANIVSGSNPMASLASASPAAALRRLSQNTVTMGAAAAAAALSEQDISRLSTSEEFRKQLMVEREVHERMMVQTLMLTNDLNERDEQISVLKQQAVALQTALAQKEKMYEQDALVRMQLGKKLEQVLMDKEEVMEENELLQEQLESLRASLDNALSSAK